MWEAFKNAIFWCIQSTYNFVDDWGAAILIITIIFRLLLMPLMHKQTKSNYMMQKIQPRIQELQTKYADDQLRLNQEVQKLYAEANFNPLAGCLPMFLQMPIFVALFQVLREMGSRPEVGDYSFYNLVGDLTLTPADTLHSGFFGFLPYLILMIIFAGATFLPMVLQQMGTPNSPQKRQTMIMSAIMTLMMLWISWRSPAGVLLFWGASSLFGVAQMRITTRMLKKRDAAAEAEIIEVKPVEVDVTRKAKKKRTHKKR